jgi:DNA-binding GntR family transcriptional regulator
MAETGDNRIAGEILEQLRTRINMLRVLAMAEPGQLETGMEGVRAIIAGIVARDLEASENATRVYVRRSGEAVLRHMDREG